MAHGVRVRNADGKITFDSSTDNVLFPFDERVVPGSIVRSNPSYTYPAQTGKQIVAFLISPYQTGDIDGCIVQSCSVTYANGVPSVNVFVDNLSTTLPVADGYLIVCATGNNQ